MTTFVLPTFYLSHGGGPWPWMEGPRYDTHRKLEAALQQLPRLVGVTPKAVLMISAHWEEADFTVMSHPNPPMLYDYNGFPENTYRIHYTAPGAPQLAEQVRGLLQSAGIAARLDPARGFDHGTFVPMAVIYPDASVPVVQLSLKRGLDPAGASCRRTRPGDASQRRRTHLGQRVELSQSENAGPGSERPSAAFDDWLQHTLEGTNFAERDRRVGFAGKPHRRARGASARRTSATADGCRRRG